MVWECLASTRYMKVDFGYGCMWDFCGRSEFGLLVATPTQQSTATHITRTYMSALPFTGTATYAQKSRGGHPSCDPAPLTTSFGSAGTGQRLHTSLEGEAWAALS